MKHTSIVVDWEPNDKGGGMRFTPEDLGVASIEEFNALSHGDQEFRLNKALKSELRIVPAARRWTAE